MTQEEPEYIWVEVFGMPKYRRFQEENPNETLRFYPNHVFIKIEVD